MATPNAMTSLLTLAGQQSGVVTMRQVLGHGISHHRVQGLTAQGQWQRLATGLYATSPEPPGLKALAWGGVLLGGEGSAVAGRAAAALHGFDLDTPEQIDVLLPHGRRVGDTASWHFERRRTMPPVRGVPPRTSVEETVLDLCREEPDRAEFWVTEAVRRRLARRDRIQRALDERRRYPARAAVMELLQPTQEGLESVLELAWHRRVEVPHGLPQATRQAALGGTRADLLYPWGLVVELDGRKGHQGEGAFRDMHRDNRNTARGLLTLRYGWTDVRRHSCVTARQVAEVLQQLGWDGVLTPCPGCRMAA